MSAWGSDVAAPGPDCKAFGGQKRAAPPPCGAVPQAKARAHIGKMAWQGQQDSNPRPSVLETDALPTELYP